MLDNVDLEEIFAIADRIAVIHHGQLSEARPLVDWTLAEIGLAMAGGPGAGAAAALMEATDAP